MNDIAVDVQQVNKSFANEQVLKNVSLQLEKGKIHGIIGRNGSGKTVLMKCICGFLRPTSGAVKVFDKIIGTDCDFATDTGMLIETPGFLIHETGMNNLKWLAKLGKGANRERISELIRMVGLDPAMKKKVGQYSLGMRQRLGIAQALLDDPALLILDEPITGLDPAAAQDLYKTLDYLNGKEGMAVVMVTHDLQAALSHARTVLHIGRKSVFCGSAADYLRSPEGRRFREEGTV